MDDSLVVLTLASIILFFLGSRAYFSFRGSVEGKQTNMLAFNARSKHLGCIRGPKAVADLASCLAS